MEKKLLSVLDWLVLLAFAVALPQLAEGKSRLSPAQYQERRLVAEITEYGCSIAQGEMGDWYVYVRASHTDGTKYRKLESVRKPHELQKALSDCNAWMEFTRQDIQRARKEVADDDHSP